MWPIADVAMRGLTDSQASVMHGGQGMSNNYQLNQDSKVEGAKIPAIRGVEHTVEWSRHMETVQIVLDKNLLECVIWPEVVI